MNATSSKTTPIMLSSHVYWNLDGFQNPQDQTALNHTIHLPYSGQRIDVDGILIPTGNILPNNPGSVNDFWTSPKQIGASFKDPAIKGNCGTGCNGYDTCYLVNRQEEFKSQLDDLGESWWRSHPVATVSSEWSGIKLDIFSEQEAFQVYSCNGQNGRASLGGNTSIAMR
jgi:aldose 1-epimerase